MPHSQFGLLKTRRFLPLFVTQFLGAFNDNVFKNALVILIIYRAHIDGISDPRLLVTAAAGIFILPFLLFSATAGQLADQHEKSKMIRTVKTAEIALMLFAAAGFMMTGAAAIYFLLFVLFLSGVQSAFFGPLKYSILPEHVGENELIGANALVESGTFLAILLGTIVGGLVILRQGGAEMISIAICAMALAGWVASLYIPPAPAHSTPVAVRLNIFATTWRLTRAAAAQRDIFFAILGISWFWLVGFTFLAQFPVYASTVLGADESVVTLFLTIFSIGIALGSLVCDKLLKGKVTSAYVPAGAFGMALGAFALWAATPALPATPHMDAAAFLSTAQAWPILASLLGISVAGGIYIVPLYAIIQARSAADRRSRTIAVNNVMNALFMVVASVFTMALLRLHVSVTDIFLLIGAANIPVGLAVRHAVRRRRKTA